MLWRTYVFDELKRSAHKLHPHKLIDLNFWQVWFEIGKHPLVPELSKLERLS